MNRSCISNGNAQKLFSCCLAVYKFKVESAFTAVKHRGLPGKLPCIPFTWWQLSDLQSLNFYAMTHGHFQQPTFF